MRHTAVRHKSRITFTVLASATLALALAACSTPAPAPTSTSAEAADPHAPEVTTVKGSMYENAISAQWFLAEPAAEDYGLTLESQWHTDAAAGLSQLIAGDLEILQASPARIADAVIQGIDIKIVAGTYASAPKFGSLLTMPDSGIKDIKDLAGKTVGMSSPVGIWANRLRKALTDEGVDLASVTFVQVPFGESAAALQRGTVDAVNSQGAVTEQLLGLGAEELIDFGAGQFEGRAENVWAVTGKFLEENPNTVAAFQCAILKGGTEANIRENAEGYFRDILGWDDATIDSTASVSAVDKPLTLEQVQQDFDDLVDIKVEPQPFDMSTILISQPDNC